MKQAWVRLEEWSDELAQAALESGADALILPEEFADRAKALGRVSVVCTGGDLEPGRDVRFSPLGSPEDEASIMGLLQVGNTVVISAPEGSGARAWEIIPVENLLAVGTGNLLVPVSSAGEIDLALGVLEKGAAGVVISTSDAAELRNLIARVKKSAEFESFAVARVESISPGGMGDRVCVDTCTFMVPGEGMLVGNSSAFLFLVQAETAENPYVSPRPFRVNAGPVHSYIRVPGGKTCYLSELEAGKSVLIFRLDGTSEEATVGRVKIEKRPLVLVEASCEGMRGTILLQNAETIRLTTPEGEGISISKLAPGDSILIASEHAGRHFGVKVDETIREG